MKVGVAAVLVGVAEWPPVLEGADRSVCCACLSWAFVSFCVRVLLSLLVLREKWGI